MSKCSIFLSLYIYCQQQYELAAEDRELPEWMQSRRKTPKRGTSGDGDQGQRSSGSLQRYMLWKRGSINVMHFYCVNMFEGTLPYTICLRLLTCMFDFLRF